MYSIRRKLGLVLLAVTAAAILFSALLVNFTINSKFNEYVSDINSKKVQRIVDYFIEVYKKDGEWTKDSGVEISHEAYMDNFCLTLKDGGGKIIWTMDPNESRFNEHFDMMKQRGDGIYNINTYEIKLGDGIVGYVDIGQYSPIFITEEDKEFKADINESMVLSVALAILFTGLFSIFLSKQFSAPIIEVSDTSVRLSNGDYSARSDTVTNIKELKDLADSVNILGENLKRQDSMRKRLISDISHEIRTPLNVLQNNLEAMVDGIVPATGERLASLNDEVVRFGRLLENLNALRGYEDREIVINAAAVNLEILMGSVIESFRPSLDGRNMNLIYNASGGGHCIVEGDMDKLRQVFINLLSNAVKYSYDGGSIWVGVCGDMNHVTVKVKDEGMGIGKEDLPFIFERMYRADRSRNKTKGSGIGLTIVKRILMLHSADISVESRPGEGTEFTVVFNRIKN